MPKQLILVGVDGSDESVAAAKVGWDLAKRAGDSCQLVHVTTDVSKMPATLPPIEKMDDLIERVQAAARREVTQVLRGAVPDDLVEGLEVRMGRAAWMLPFVVDEFDASLLVLGRKKHSGPVRWFGGSTVHHVVRSVDVPILIVDETTDRFKRFLVAVDESHAAQAVLAAAVVLAERCGAELRVIHVIEPVPYLGEFPTPIDDAGYAEWAGERFEKRMADSPWSDLDRVVRLGPATNSILDEAKEWGADLVIAGTHGAGWLDRILVGSTTQRLLNRLAGSLYVIPVEAPVEGAA